MKETEVVLERRAVMLGRIVKFRRGDQYEEMQGRDDAGKSNVHSDGQTNRQADAAAAGDASVAARDTTPDGTLAVQLVFI